MTEKIITVERDDKFHAKKRFAATMRADGETVHVGRNTLRSRDTLWRFLTRDEVKGLEAFRKHIAKDHPKKLWYHMRHEAGK